VLRKDVNLSDSIAAELPAILYTFLTAYHDLRRSIVPGGDLHESLHPAVREWRGEVRAASNKLFEYLSLEDDERVVVEPAIPRGVEQTARRRYRVNLAHEPGAITLRENFKRWYLQWLGKDAVFTNDEAAFEQHGFTSPATRVFVCHHCGKRAASGSCAKYATDDRTKKYVIEGMRMNITVLPTMDFIA
jgi:hypothetical protein